MTLTEALTRCKQQLRFTPLVTDDNLLSWLRQSVRRFCDKSKWLDFWTILVCKQSQHKYLLPGNHLTTTAAYYDATRLQQCTVFDSQLVAPDTPVYYYEDEWEDESSEAIRSEFVIHYALNELWPLQLCRSQNSQGRKTLTLVAAPTVDGEAPTLGASLPLGMWDGTMTVDAFYWPDTLGIPYYITSTVKNLTLFYKAVDRQPQDVTDTVDWVDLMGLMYVSGTAAMALVTEDDEYDRYRAWLYQYVTDTMASILRAIAINTRMR